MNESDFPSRLSDRDRALMLSVARRDFELGHSSIEEYEDVLQRCRTQPGPVYRGLRRLFRIVSRRAKSMSNRVQRAALKGMYLE
jgi:hypothetical protein